MPTIKVFLWQLCHSSLPVRGTLLKWGLNFNSVCPLCLCDIDSIEHLFKDCQMVKKVWELAVKHHWIPSTFSPTANQDFLQYLYRIHSFHNPTLEQKISFILWRIWKSRNSAVFNNDFFNPVACLIRAKKEYAEWRIRTRLSVDHFLKGPSSSPPTSPHLVRWHPPSPGFVKLNFDGSLINSSATGGFIIRDWTGKLVKVRANYYGDTSILVAEARTLHDGLRLAIQAWLRKIVIEGDNKIMVQFRH